MAECLQTSFSKLFQAAHLTDDAVTASININIRENPQSEDTETRNPDQEIWMREEAPAPRRAAEAKQHRIPLPVAVSFLFPGGAIGRGRNPNPEAHPGHRSSTTAASLSPLQNVILARCDFLPRTCSRIPRSLTRPPPLRAVERFPAAASFHTAAMASPLAARALRLCRACRSQPSPRIQVVVAGPSVPRQALPSSAVARSTVASQQHREFSSSRPTLDTAASSFNPSPPAPETHYELFPSTLPDGPPPSGHFPIDVRALRREFLQLQSRYHPDLHPQGPAKARAEAASALINEAYRTLQNPLLRAQYLLSLRGVDVANDETLKVEEPDLLGLVLEAREEIEDAAEEEDLAGPRTVNDERIRASEEVLEKAFREDDVEAAKREAVRLRYWVNIKDSLENWEKGKPVVLQH